MLGKPLNMIFSLDSSENRGLYFEDTQRAIIYVRQHSTIRMCITQTTYKSFRFKFQIILIYPLYIHTAIFTVK